MKESTKKELRSWLLTVFLPVAVVLLVNLFLCKLVIVDGSSMYPTLHDRDVILVDMLDHDYETGDIIVFCMGEKNFLWKGKNLVKRVIATEGQTVHIDYDTNQVYVDGQLIEEDYLNFSEEDAMSAFSDTDYVVPEGCLFVMGDNRNHSSDSRSDMVSFVPEENVMGTEFCRIGTGKFFSKG